LTLTKSPIFNPFLIGKWISLKFLVLHYKFQDFQAQAINISSVLHIISSDLLFTESISNKFKICHLLAFSWLDMESFIFFSAIVPDLSEYLAIYAKSKSISPKALTVFWN
jgi:hypothetical protein